MTDTPQDRYIAIARQSFAKAGYHGVSLAQLARKAGVSKQAFLHFFASKEKLYAAVLNKLSQDLCQEIALYECARPEDQLVAYFQAFARRSLKAPNDAHLVIYALLMAEPDAKQWPLKPYLEALTDLGMSTEAWRGGNRNLLRAEIFAILGSLQYVAISETTLNGLYGIKDKARIEDAFLAQIDQRAIQLVAPAPPV